MSEQYLPVSCYHHWSTLEHGLEVELLSCQLMTPCLYWAASRRECCVDWRDTSGGSGRTCWAGWRHAVASEMTTAMLTGWAMSQQHSKRFQSTCLKHETEANTLEQRWMDKYSTALQGFVDFFLPLWALTDITLQRSTVLSSTEAVKDIHNDENMAFQSTWHGFTNTAVWHQECDHSMLRTQWQQLGFTLSALYITYSFVIANYKILI